MTKSSRASRVLGGKHKSKGSEHKPHSIHVRRGKSGGYIAEHHYKSKSPDEPTPESEEHVLPDMDALQDHMADNMSDQPDQEAQPQAPPPQQGAAMPSPQPGM